MNENNLDDHKDNLEETLVEQYIVLYQEYQRLNSLAQETKKKVEAVESELIDLLNDENKKSSARFKGIGHVTCMDPVVSNAYIVKGQEEALFEFLRNDEREDLIKTSVHHTSLAAYINQRIKDGKDAPPGTGYIMKQKLRAYPEKK